MSSAAQRLRDSAAADQPPAGAGPAGRDRSVPVPLQRALPAGTVADDQLARENAVLSSENEFLRSVVARLQAELGALQRRAGVEPSASRPVPGAEAAAPEDLPPWDGSSRYLSPLLVAYDDRVRALQGALDLDKREMQRLADENRQLGERNASLQAELTHSVSRLARRFQASGAGPADAGADEAERQEEAREMAERLRLHREQETILRQQEAALRAEVSRLQAEADEAAAELAAREAELSRSQAARGEAEQRVERLLHERSEGRASLAEATHQLESARRELAATRAAEEAARSDLARESAHRLELAEQLGHAQAQLRAEGAGLRRELQAARQREADVAARVAALQHTGDEAAERTRALGTELLESQRVAEGAVQELERAERQLAALRAQELDVMRQGADARRAVAEAALARDQALAREEQARRELAAAGARLAEQADALRKEGEAKVAEVFGRAKRREEKAAEELKSLELACAQLQAQKDRLNRERAAAEAQARSGAEAARQRLDGVLDELQAAQADLAAMRTERDIGREQAAGAEHQLASLQAQWKRDRATLVEQADALRAAADSLEEKAARLREAAGTAQEDQRRAREREAEAVRQRNELERSLTSRIQDLTESRRREVADLQSRLDDAYRMHEEGEARAAALLEEQEALRRQWRAEALLVEQRYRDEVDGLQAELGRLGARNAELEVRAQGATAERDNLAAAVQNLRARAEAATQEALAARRRADAAGDHLEQLARRYDTAMATNRALQNDIDRIEAEAAQQQRLAQSRERRRVLHEVVAHGDYGDAEDESGQNPAVIASSSQTAVV